MNVFPEARTIEIPCKPNAGTKSPVDERFISRTRSALSSWLPTSRPTTFCPCIIVESKTRTYHGRDGTEAAHGGAMRGRAAQDADGTFSPRRKKFLFPSRRWKNNILGASLEARTIEILRKPMEEQNPRLATGSSAVYHQDRERSSFLAADQCTDAYVSL